MFLFTGLLFTQNLSAQNEVFIYGPEWLCSGSCGTWGIEQDPTQGVGIYEWYFVRDINSGAPRDTLYTTTTDIPFVDWCPEEEGLITVFVQILGPNGSTDEVLGTGSTQVLVEFFSTEFFPEGFGSHRTHCTQDSFQVNSAFPNNSNCFEACVGQTSILTIEQLNVIGLNGTFYQVYPNERDWSVRGGTIIDYFGTADSNIVNGVEVLWETAGPGSISLTYFIEDQCTVATEVMDFCFDVLPAPEASFATQPAANANGILEVCEGQAIFFFNTSTEAESFTWDFGDGSGSTAVNPQHTYDQAGTYQISLIATTSCECSDTTFLTVAVEGNETPFIDCVATICAGESVTYQATTNCSSYMWTVSSNGIIVDGGDTDDDFVTIEWGSGPIGEITLATDDCPDLSTCTTAAYMQVPVISDNAVIEGPTEVCRGSQTVYEITPFTGTEYVWSVSPLGTIIAGQGTPRITVEWFDGPISPQVQSVSVNYSNCYLECGGSDQLDVFIRPEFYAEGPIEVCANTTADYTAFNTQTNLPFAANFRLIASNGSTVWSGSGGMVSIDFSMAAGTYDLEVVPQQTSDFCTEEYTQTIEVIAEPGRVTMVEGQTDICPGIGYTYRVADDAPGERYRWTITNGTSVTEREGKSIAVIWEANPPYSLEVVRLQPPLFCSSAPETININRFTSFSVQGDEQVCQDQIATYTSTATGDVYYAWSIQPASAGTITGDPTAASVDVLWHTNGPAQLVLDICGQQESLAVTVNATPQPIVNHPTALCPNETAPVSTTIAYAAYAWQDSVGTVLSTDPNPDLAPGYYRLEVTDAIGCTGTTTFSIYGYPESNISISTPDFNLFCNLAPSTTLYANNTEDGYTYQWFQDGMALAGETTTSYTATTFGNYYVAIVDENGCAFNSNTIRVAENCGDIRGTGGGSACPNAGHDFTAANNGDCEDRAYTAQAVGASTDPFWNFDDPASGLNNSAMGVNVTHTYQQPGFYRVLMGAYYPDGMGGLALCRTIIPDTIYAVADFEYDGVCPGLPVQFYDLTTFLEDFTTLTSWSWDFGDPASGPANTSTDKDPLHTFSTGGTYQVTLTVTTSQGCRTTTTKSVEIFPLPAVSFVEPPLSCAATALPFVAEVAATVSEVRWTFGEPSSGEANESTLFNSFHAYAGPGTYNVELEATNVYTCTNSFSASINITPNTLSGDISPAGNQQLCEGDTLTLTAPGTAADSWEWSTSETTQALTVQEAGVYTVTLTDADGCTYTPEPSIVDIIPAPQSPIRAVDYDDFGQASSYTYDTIRVCRGEDVFLETTEQAGYTYRWSTGSTETSISFTEERGNLLPEGTHEITLTVTNTANGCSHTEVFVVVVQPTPDQPLLAGNTAVLCAGSASTIQVTNPSGSLAYNWSNGEAGTSITTSEAGNYTVIARNSFGCRAESEPLEVLTGPDISLVPSGCHTRCAPDTLCLPIIPNIVSYQWYQDGSPIPAPDGTVANLIIDQTGSYTLEMTDGNGCVQTADPLNVDILPGYGTIRGLVFYDDNNSGTIDAGDSPAASITLEADNGSGFQADATTSLSGDYAILDIPQGDYIVTLDQSTVPDGWEPQVAELDTTLMGCDQLLELYWLLVPSCNFDTTFAAEVCEGEQYDFRGMSYDPGGPYTVMNNPTDGCDSSWTFTVSENIETLTNITAVVCAGTSYDFQGQAYTAGTDTIFMLTNSSGCDSLVQLQITNYPELVFSVTSEPSCPNSASGSLEIEVLSGNTATNFALDGGTSQVSPVFTDLAANTYTVELRDENGCTYQEVVTVEA
ncbi:MAG: PKD domain-containing protein, partial [Bacteroidetes bacterium]